MKVLNGMDEIMTPAEFILTRGYCMYCETNINDDDRCGCDGETIYYLTQAVVILEKALQPLADAWDNDFYNYHPFPDSAYISIFDDITYGDAKRAHEALEKVEVML